MLRLLAIACVAAALGAQAFSGLPSSWPTARKIIACNDYCMGEQSSNAAGFNFQNKGWELCLCPIAQESNTWQQSLCFEQCVSRCLSTLGKCANNKANNSQYKGYCCTTANSNSTVQNECFAVPGGACYSTDQ